MVLVEHEIVALWDMESHEKLLALEGRGSLFDTVAFSPDGNVLAASNWRGVASLARHRGRKSKRQNKRPQKLSGKSNG